MSKTVVKIELPRQRQIAPAPRCPVHMREMVLKRPKSGDWWQPFWGCPVFPDCRETLRPLEREIADPRQLSMLPPEPDAPGEVWEDV